MLILALVFFYRITSEKHTDNITISKNIVSEKYEDVVYFEDSNCLYAYSKNQYTVFDYNGNKLYSFNNISKDNIVTVSKKYYIIRDNVYHVYNINGEDLVNIEKRLHCPDLISNVHCPACIARERAYVPLIRTRTYSRKVFEKGRWRKRYPRL